MEFIKNKKIILLIVLIVIMVALGVVVVLMTSGQNSQQNQPADQPAQEQQGQEGEEQAQEPAEEPEAGPEVAMAMSNHNNDGKFLVDGDVVYYTDYDSEGGQSLVKENLDGSGKTVLKEDCETMCLALYEGDLYGVVWASDQDPAICRIPTDGGEATELVEGATDLQIEDGKLYYNKGADTDGDYLNVGFYCAEMDGSGESLLLDKAVYDAYVVDGKIYYQDEEDGKKLRMMDMETVEDKQLTKTACYSFVLDGDKGYYVEVSDPEYESSGNLVEMDMETGDTTVLAGDAYKEVVVVLEKAILYCDGQNNYRISQIDKGAPGKKELVDINDPDNICVGGDKILFVDSDYSWQYVEGIYMCNQDGSDLRRMDE